ncbi:MAG: hypothetical protein AAF940_10670 [Pseudomonadota bacterium]
MIDTAKVTGAARRLKSLLTVGVGLLLALTAVGAVMMLMDPIGVGEELATIAGYDAVTIAPWQAWALSAIVAVHLVLWIVLLAVARSTFNQLADRMPAMAAKSARQAATLLWGMLVWGIVSQPIASAVATWGNPAGERALAIGFGTAQLSIAFSALIAGCMAHALALGAELWQDHQEVV